MKDCLTYRTPNWDTSYPPTSKVMSDNQAIHISPRQIHYKCNKRYFGILWSTLLDDGAYQVRLPIRAARKKFYQLEWQLDKNKQLREHYNICHMAPVEDNNETGTNLKPYYMLHHGVVKESSSTTKFRVGFNASEKKTN
ncbi:hypothetical protein PR048_006726 [Dryococelus australis]|uniref:Uncharacterized protein n=1 Tax=Dryococelus australis TaxID=614101 RepID=A0ABQ9IBT5_9NEOP|nr:hypothetical protein PR048_006726 [Dryococelus australis]